MDAGRVGVGDVVGGLAVGTEVGAYSFEKFFGEEWECHLGCDGGGGEDGLGGDCWRDAS